MNSYSDIIQKVQDVYCIQIPFAGLVEETLEYICVGDTGIEVNVDFNNKITEVYVHKTQARFLEHILSSDEHAKMGMMEGIYFSNQPAQSSMDFKGLRFLFHHTDYRDLVGIEYIDRDKYWLGFMNEQEWFSSQSRLQVRHEFLDDDFSLGYVSVPVFDVRPLRNKRLSLLSFGYDCPAEMAIDAAGRVRGIRLYDRPETKAMTKWAGNEDEFVRQLSQEETDREFCFIEGKLTFLLDSSSHYSHNKDVYGLRLLFTDKGYENELFGFLGYQYLEPEKYGVSNCI